MSAPNHYLLALRRCLYSKVQITSGVAKKLDLREYHYPIGSMGMVYLPIHERIDSYIIISMGITSVYILVPWILCVILIYESFNLRESPTVAGVGGGTLCFPVFLPEKK